MYWRPCHTEAVQRYLCATSTAAKNRIIDRELYPALHELCRRALTKNGIEITEDRLQDLLLHLVYKTLPKIKTNMLQGCLQFLFVSASNYTKSYFSEEGKYQVISLDSLTGFSDDNDPDSFNCYCSEAYIQNNYMNEETGPACLPVDLDAESEVLAVRKKIIDEIDLRLKGQHIVNTTNSVFLMLLRQYILDNDYDVRGFGEFVMGAMHLKLSTYRVIAGRIGIYTFPLNEKLLKEHKPKKKRIR